MTNFYQMISKDYLELLNEVVETYEIFMFFTNNHLIYLKIRSQNHETGFITHHLLFNRFLHFCG